MYCEEATVRHHLIAAQFCKKGAAFAGIGNAIAKAAKAMDAALKKSGVSHSPKLLERINAAGAASIMADADLGNYQASLKSLGASAEIDNKAN